MHGVSLLYHLDNLEENANVMRERGDRDGLREPGQMFDGQVDNRTTPLSMRVQRHRGATEDHAEEQRGRVEPQRPPLHRHFRRALLAAGGALLHAGYQQHEAGEGHRDSALRGAGCRRHVVVAREEDCAHVHGEREGYRPTRMMPEKATKNGKSMLAFAVFGRWPAGVRLVVVRDAHKVYATNI